MHTRWWWSSLVGYPVLPGPSDLVFLKLADGRGWAQSLSFQKGRLLSFTNKNLGVSVCVGSFRPSTEVQMWEHSVCRHELKDVDVPPGHPREMPGDPRGSSCPTKATRPERSACTLQATWGCSLAWQDSPRSGDGQQSMCCFFLVGLKRKVLEMDYINHDWF